MSHDALNEFLSRLSSDEGLQAAMTEYFGGFEDDLPAEDVSRFALSQGYDFTVDELEEELADEILEGIAGGGIRTFPKVEIDLTASYGTRAIKVTYTPNSQSFNFVKLS